MIEVKGVTLKYPDGTLALKKIDLEVTSKKVIYVTGPSGSGKTSLLKLLMGIEYPTEGTVTVLGKQITKGRDEDIRQLRLKIGPIFQEFKLIKGRTAIENVMTGMRITEVPPHQLKARALVALDEVGMKHKALSPVENLSWGECQRIAIARAVSRKPALILADEPTGNLDRDNAVKIMDLLASFKSENTSVVITTHATHLLRSDSSEEVLAMEDGRLGILGRASV